MYILAVKFELCDFGISAYELSALIFINQPDINPFLGPKMFT